MSPWGSFSTLPFASLWILGAQQLGMLSTLTSASAANHPLVQSFLLLLSIEKKWLLGHFQGFFFFFEEFKVILAIAPFLVWPSFCFYVIANYVHISRACNFFF